MVCPSTPGAPLLALTFRYASHTSHFEISNDFPCDTDLPTRILPGTLVDQTDNPRWSGPFAPPPLQGLHHYYEPVRQHAPRRYSTPRSFCYLVLFLLPPQTLRAEVSGPAFPRLSRASRNCPVAVMKTARWWPWDLPSGGHQRRSVRCGASRSPRVGWCSGQVGWGDWLVAVRAGAARADTAGEEVAVRAAALVDVAGFALGAFVDDAGGGIGARAHRVPPNGVTPSPANAWDRRTDSPLVRHTWAWCRSRSTVAVARVLGISSSNEAGCKFDETATERFSYAASTRRYRPSAASCETGNRPMSSTTTRSARRTRAMALVTVSSARCRRRSTPRSSRVNHATRSTCSTACCPRASSRNVLPVPDGPHTTRFSRRWTHSRVPSACWVGAGIEDAAGDQAWNVLPVGNPAVARRVARAERSRPADSSLNRARRTSTGSQRWALAVATTSGACRRIWGRRNRRSSASRSSGSGGAVSYTHLRAHETGRNLVC